MRSTLLAGLLFSITAILSAQQPGTVNTNFGVNGLLHFNMDTMNANAYDFTYTPGGKILIVGTKDRNCDGLISQNVMLMRLNADGTPDNTFGEGGIQRIFGLSHTAYRYEPTTILCDPSGNIYVCGTRTDVCGGSPNYTTAFVAKMFSDGIGDENFDNYYGVNSLSFPGSSEATAVDMLLIGSNIYVCGERSVTGTMKAYVAKIGTSNGAYVVGFGTNGVQTWSGGGQHRFNGITTDNASTIYLSGYTGTGKNVASSVNTTSGAFNVSFAGNGFFEFDIGAPGDNEYSYDILYDGGKIYMCGYTSGKPFVCRITTAGILDNTFNGNGKRIETLPESGFLIAKKLVEYSNTIYVGVDMGNYNYAKVYALNSTGGLETTFGTGGFANSEFGPAIETDFMSIKISGSGNLVALGNPQRPVNQLPALNNFSYRYQWGLSCLSDDGDPVNVFSGSYYTVKFLNLSGESTNQIGLQGSQIIFAGTYYDFFEHANNVTYVRRHNPDGSIDNTFHERDFKAYTIGALYVYPDGRILMGGGEADPVNNTSSIVLYRFKANGDSDSTFGTNGKVIRTTPNITMFLSDLDLDASGNIYGSGNASDDGFTYRAPFAMKLSSNGAFDSNFDGDGYWQHSVPANSYYASTNGFLNNVGNYVLMNAYGNSGPVYGDIAFITLGPDGSQVGSQQLAGLQEGPTAYVYDFGGHIFAGPNGKFYVMASFYEADILPMKICRFNANLTLDATFGIGGVRKITEPNDYIYPEKGFLAPDGKPMFLYTRRDTASSGTGDSRIVIHRMDTSGTDDVTFSFDGKAILQSPNQLFGNDMLLYPNGLLYITGTDQMPGDQADFVWAQVFTEYALDIDDVTNEALLQLYPNPATETFWTDAGEIQVEQVWVRDMSGKTIAEFSQPFEGKFSLPLGNISSGAYFITYRTDKGTVTKKLIVAR